MKNIFSIYWPMISLGILIGVIVFLASCGEISRDQTDRITIPSTRQAITCSRMIPRHTKLTQLGIRWRIIQTENIIDNGKLSHTKKTKEARKV